MPQVREAATGVVERDAARDRSRDGPFRIATMIQVDGADVPTWSGEPVVVSGRLPDLDAPDELLVSDNVASALGVGAGHSGLGERPGRRVAAVLVDGRRRGANRRRAGAGTVGLARSHRATRCSTPASAWSSAHGDDVLRGGNTVGVCLVDGMIPRRSSPTLRRACRVGSSTSPTPWTRS